MRCRECREKIFSSAEKAAEKSEGQAYPQGLTLPKDVRKHIESCSSCASLAEAVRLTSEETALRTEAPDRLAERVAAAVINPAVDFEADAPKDNVADFAVPERSGEDSRFGKDRFGLGRAVSLAAAAVFLVAVSVSVTLMVSGNGPGGAPGGETAGNVATAEGKEAETEEAEAIEAGKAAEEGPEIVESGKAESEEKDVATIHLTLEAPNAQSVAVVGDWNDWNPQKHQMKDEEGNGIWELRVQVKRGEEYRYQFLINGEKWIPDPNAPLQVEDGFGGTDSILNI
ncbi:MAG: isoamylase early set domain-containing protein [Spirochaetia bacterium]